MGPGNSTAGQQGRRRELPEELNAPWGLDSIDQSGLPLNGAYDYDNMGGCGFVPRAWWQPFVPGPDYILLVPDPIAECWHHRT